MQPKFKPVLKGTDPLLPEVIFDLEIDLGWVELTANGVAILWISSETGKIELNNDIRHKDWGLELDSNNYPKVVR